MTALEEHQLMLTVREKASRLDSYLAGLLPGLSRSRLQKLIRQGNVVVNQRKARAAQKLEPGDEVCIYLPPPEEPVLIPEQIPVTVLYEDNNLVVIDKPAGLVVHPSPGHTSHTLVNAILARCPDIKGFEDMRPGIVHRLDRDTSGVMVIAKNPQVQRFLMEQFRSRSVLKVYLVLVKGRLSPPQGMIEAPLGRDPADRKRMAVVSGGRPATTSYKVREYLGDYTLLEVVPQTGRTHQIRVHLAAIGHPVVGDAVYGVKSSLLKRQFVHAYRLGFCLPGDGGYREFVSELPADLQHVINELRGQISRQNRRGLVANGQVIC